MKVRLSAGVAAVMLAATALGSSAAQAQQSTGHTRTVLFENESVQVVRVYYAAGAESPLHSHEFPGRTIYVLKGGEVEILPGGDSSKARKIPVKAGQVLWRPAETHIVRNAGSSDLEVLEVEVKNLGPGG